MCGEWVFKPFGVHVPAGCWNGLIQAPKTWLWFPFPTPCSVMLNRQLETSWSIYTTKPAHPPNQDFSPLTSQSQLLNIYQDIADFFHVLPHFLSILPLNVNDLLTRKARQNQQETGQDSKACSPVLMVPNQVLLPDTPAAPKPAPPALPNCNRLSFFSFGCTGSSLWREGFSLVAGCGIWSMRLLYCRGRLAVPCHVGSEFPDQGLNPRRLYWKHRVLNTALPGKYLSFFTSHLFPSLFPTRL